MRGRPLLRHKGKFSYGNMWQVIDQFVCPIEKRKGENASKMYTKQKKNFIGERNKIREEYQFI